MVERWLLARTQSSSDKVELFTFITPKPNPFPSLRLACYASVMQQTHSENGEQMSLLVL